VIEELTLYAYKVDPHTEEILPALDDKNNHTIDALRYALEELRRSGYRPAAQPTTKRTDRYDRKPREDEINWKTL
jgi:phage terminase large subunit